MPSSIQTSPPAMHRRSLHPNRIYPAINGLDHQSEQSVVTDLPAHTGDRSYFRPSCNHGDCTDPFGSGAISEITNAKLLLRSSGG